MKKLACLSLLLAAVASPAYADGCGGRLIEYQKLVARKSGKVVAQLQLYYNQSNGMNCAIVKHSDETWNKSMYTAAFIYTCPKGGGSCTLRDKDAKDYKYEAGPVRTPGENKCVMAVGQIEPGNDSAQAQTAVHCD